MSVTLLILAFSVKDLLFLGELLVSCLFSLLFAEDCGIILIFSSIDREQMISLNVSEKDANTFKAKVLGQDVPHIVDVVDI